MRPTQGVQRGSVMDMPTYPGDPLTPGVGATKDAKRLALKDAATITKIPVLPISYGDAQPLLAALGGPGGAGGVARRTADHLPPRPRAGAGAPASVEFDWSLKPLYDVIAKIPGTTAADEWVIRGNHHDAWVNGAEDPVSGQVAELEEARALGELLQAGLAPEAHDHLRGVGRRGAGLLGSTEWVETHADGAEGARGGLHQHRRERPRLPRASAARTRSSSS